MNHELRKKYGNRLGSGLIAIPWWEVAIVEQILRYVPDYWQIVGNSVGFGSNQINRRIGSRILRNVK